MLLLDMISHATAKEWLLEQPLNGIAITTMCDSTIKISLTVSNKCRWICGVLVCTQSCFYQRCCQERALRESSYGNDYCSHSVVFLLSHVCGRTNNTQYIKEVCLALHLTVRWCFVLTMQVALNFGAVQYL